jgi:hypothetical protein
MVVVSEVQSMSRLVTPSPPQKKGQRPEKHTHMCIYSAVFFRNVLSNVLDAFDEILAFLKKLFESMK